MIITRKQLDRVDQFFGEGTTTHDMAETIRTLVGIVEECRDWIPGISDDDRTRCDFCMSKADDWKDIKHHELCPYVKVEEFLDEFNK
jgi:hypothetical protein